MNAAVSIPPFYSVHKLGGMGHLRQLFPNGEADYMNFVMFSTSGVHGSYLTIEEVAESLTTDEPSALTVLVQRICTEVASSAAWD